LTHIALTYLCKLLKFFCSDLVYRRSVACSGAANINASSRRECHQWTGRDVSHQRLQQLAVTAWNSSCISNAPLHWSVLNSNEHHKLGPTPISRIIAVATLTHYSIKNKENEPHLLAAKCKKIYKTNTTLNVFNIYFCYIASLSL